MMLTEWLGLTGTIEDLRMVLNSLMEEQANIERMRMIRDLSEEEHGRIVDIKGGRAAIEHDLFLAICRRAKLEQTMCGTLG